MTKFLQVRQKMGLPCNEFQPMAPKFTVRFCCLLRGRRKEPLLIHNYPQMVIGTAIPEKRETNKVSLLLPNGTFWITLQETRIIAEYSGFTEFIRQKSKLGKPSNLNFQDRSSGKRGCIEKGILSLWLDTKVRFHNASKE